MSAIEIYNEKVRDLLKDGTERQNLPLLDDPERGTVAEGLSEEWPRSEQHLCQLLRQIEARRTVGCHLPALALQAHRMSSLPAIIARCIMCASSYHLFPQSSTPYTPSTTLKCAITSQQLPQVTSGASANKHPDPK